VLRFGIAVPFWRSGILKWDGFLEFNDTAIDPFTGEFMLHLPGGPYPYPAPATKAFLSGFIVFPILLVFGLATRSAATGLLFMTCIVELTVPDGWPIHITIHRNRTDTGAPRDENAGSFRLDPKELLQKREDERWR
jgi:putative oxidoreductase